MPDHGHRRAINSTPTSALRAVAVLLAVVLLLAAAAAILDAVSLPGSPGAVTGPHTRRPIRPVVLVDSSRPRKKSAVTPLSEPTRPRTLLDGAGRLRRWNPVLSRRPGDVVGVFCHRGLRRTEQELEHEAEPIIEVRDQRVLAVPLEPVPARQIRLNKLVVLPGLGELSPVIGVWPCTDRYARLLYVCTDNGDWAHRRADSPLLRADIRTPGRPKLLTATRPTTPPNTRPHAPHSQMPQTEEPCDG